MLVGSRVADVAGCRGTVRYVGPVVTSKDPTATWVGVEWDDPSRGKHDGAVERQGTVTRYFSCAEGAGSFVKPSKLDCGTSFVEALGARYVTMDAPLEAPDQVLAYANTKRGATKKIEMKGELKVRAVQQLHQGHVESVALRASRISTLGDGSLGLDNLAHVDLQCNLLGSWATVCEIVAALPRITSLDVSGNRLASTDSLQALKPLVKLAANDVGLRSWADVEKLLVAADSLQELHVATNPVGDITSSNTYPTLKLLDVADTGLREPPSLRIFPGLVELHASQNRSLKRVDLNLEALAIASCGVDSWGAVDELAVKRLRFGNDNPVSANLGPSETRAFVIARLPMLTQLNGADISKKERLEAERRFLRVALADASFAPPPDRLNALKLAYPDLAASQHNKESAGRSLGANLLPLSLRCVAAASAGAPLQRHSLPASTKVSLLKRLCAKIFDLPVDAISLYFKIDDGAMPTFLDDDDAPLAYFALPDSGCTVDVADKLLE